MANESYAPRCSPGPEVEHELLDLAGAIGAAFPPGVLEAVLRGVEESFADQLDAGQLDDAGD